MWNSKRKGRMWSQLIRERPNSMKKLHNSESSSRQRSLFPRRHQKSSQKKDKHHYHCLVATVCHRRHCCLPGHSRTGILPLGRSWMPLLGPRTSKDSMSLQCLWNILLINCIEEAVIAVQELVKIMTSFFGRCNNLPCRHWHCAKDTRLGYLPWGHSCRPALGARSSRHSLDERSGNLGPSHT
jgi:hypothetical protein